MNQLIVIPGNIRLLLVFVTPHTLKATVFLHFSVGLIIEQTFDKIRSGLLEQNILGHMFGYNFIVFFENLLLTATINHSILQVNQATAYFSKS